MKENKKTFSLILQNNASKEFYVYSGLTDISDNHLFYEFEEHLEVPEGEYTYACYVNNRDDVVYDLKTPLLSTILRTGDGDIMLRYLQPEVGLLQVGQAKTSYTNIYDNNENNTIFYYDN